MSSLPQSQPSSNGQPKPEPPAAFWPLWTDSWFWEPNDPELLAELERLEIERLTDMSDAPAFEPSAEDWRDYHAAFDRIDRITDQDILAAGLPVG
jgi:hypothetical protein